ncbi:MAG TPA: RNA-binding protein [Brevundimonas sp.]|uniref:RNA-binding protein n=1 Tax=Brevundimonas sp. TaxID=1871086 RepID=UPI002DE33249|nr:RNA-binding protein [Brevundimonas sp.]
MSDVEAWLDETPGETRGCVAREGRFIHLLIDREGTPPQHRLGARVVGRVIERARGLDAAFVDLGCDGPHGFLPGKAGAVGERLELEVVAEPREAKGPTLRRLGAGEGAPRLLAPGPTVRDLLAAAAPGVAPVEGADAIHAVMEAEQEALSDRVVVGDLGLDLVVQRTRALIAVDLDLSADAPRAARDRANRRGLAEAARLIGLKGWAGLVVVDLIGGAQDGERIMAAARAAFDGPQVAFGPLSRFGLLQLSLPWSRTPVEEALRRDGPALRGALAGVRALRLALLQDRAAPRLELHLSPEEASVAAPLVARLGPRAVLRPDADRAPGAHMVAEDRS